ncbi:MAG: hypothetical protein M3321_00160 [Actinomycetota bacterium]|nr:hypothetical protein [Actinomycetota bacterium]
MRGAEHREAARRATSDAERQRQNRASADLHVVAEHIARQEQTHHDLSELHAWEDARNEAGDYGWLPNDAQKAAIDAYTNDPSGGPDRLLADLNRLKS